MMSVLRPGLVSVTFRQLSPREIVGLAAASGLEGIEWGGDVHVPSPEAALEVGRMTEDAGLAVAAYGSYWRAEEERLSRMTDGFGPVAEAAALLDAPTIRVWAGRESSRLVDGATKARVADALRWACEFVDDATTISLEYHAGTLTDTLASALRLVRRVDHPALRLYWQPVPERSPAERLEEVHAVLPYLSNLHVFQWTRPESEIERHPLSEGEAEWSEVFRTVSAPLSPPGIGVISSSPSGMVPLKARHERKGGSALRRGRPRGRGCTEEGEILKSTFLSSERGFIEGDPSESRFALLEFVPNDDPSLLLQEAATLRRLLAESA